MSLSIRILTLLIVAAVAQALVVKRQGEDRYGWSSVSWSQTCDLSRPLIMRGQ